MIIVKSHKINLILPIIILLIIMWSSIHVIHNKLVSLAFILYAISMFIIAIALLLKFLNKKLIINNGKITIYSSIRKKRVIGWKEVEKIIIYSDKERCNGRPLRGETIAIFFDQKKISIPSYYYGYSEMIRYIKSFYNYKIKYVDKAIPVIRLFRP